MRTINLGLGINSVALAIGCYERGIKIDRIMFADPGCEFPKTYGYKENFNLWLINHGMPEITTVKTVDRYGEVLTIEQDCLRYKSLPAIAYGYKKCSLKFKAQPIEKWLNHDAMAIATWSKHEKVLRAIGYDAGERRRAKNYDNDKYIFWYPLIEWGWDRTDCMAAIVRHGLPLPGKSSCFICPSMKVREVVQLKKEHPDLFERALVIERNAELYHLKGLARDRSWASIEANEGNQVGVWDTGIMPCDCYEGDE